MSSISADARDVARRLWARAASDAEAPDEIAVAAIRVYSQLNNGLGRWIGVGGYRALLDRAFLLVRGQHPALDAISLVEGDEARTAAAVRAHGAGEVVAALVALLATLVELLGRIIGTEMAVRLVEQIGLPTPRGVVSNATGGGRDG